MKLISLECSGCGAKLEINPELKKCMCQYCGKEMLIDDEVKKVEHRLENGFEFGYHQELGRMKALQDVKAKLLEDEKNKIDRLTHTPKAQKIWRKENISKNKKLNQSEIYPILVKKLNKDKELSEQYKNGDRCNPDLYGGKQSFNELSISFAACSVVSIIFPYVSPAFAIIGIVFGILALVGFRVSSKDKAKTAIALNAVQLIISIVCTYFVKGMLKV